LIFCALRPFPSLFYQPFSDRRFGGVGGAFSGVFFGRFFCSFLVFFGAVLVVVFVSFWGCFQAVFVRFGGIWLFGWSSRLFFTCFSIIYDLLLFDLFTVFVYFFIFPPTMSKQARYC